MEHYVTLFDSLFLPQGLALYQSMRREVKEFKLWVLCVDELAFKVLSKLDLPDVRLINLIEVETPELLAVKSERSKGEYCWTLTPFAPMFVFEAEPSIERVTYLDADLWFRKSPEEVFEEFGCSGKHVLITDHLYAPEHDLSETSGRFCVQFMTFRRAGGEVVRRWWQDRCVEWCYARFDDGRFGDQMYLNDWPSRFGPEVHVLSALHPVLAPWNATNIPYSTAFAVHFHGFRILSRTEVMIPDNYEIPDITYRKVYKRYLQDIVDAVHMLDKAQFVLKAQAPYPTLYQRFLTRLRRMYWKLRVMERTEVITLPFKY